MNKRRDAVDKIRQFNRFYTVFPGVLDRNFMGKLVSQELVEKEDSFL